MFITRLHELGKRSPGFYFSYELDDEQCLNRIFWADQEARQNYSMFGDSLSYDATYGTNKYFTIFTPFTGVDHHKRSVFFGGALLANEYEKSYEWCLKTFMDCMGHKEPNVIVTDQDPALKNVIPITFPNTRHRLCMWHIIQKMVDKVGSKICKETDFLSQINEAVWDNELEPEVFEDRWLQIIYDFELQDNKWLCSMYRDRGCWIPAFFRDMEMGGLLRMTQRSESENSYFKRLENHFGTLLEFWMQFETAVEQQRYSQKRLDHDCLHSLPVTVTLSKLESHVALVYSHKVFYEVQAEIKTSLCYCGLGGLTTDGNNHVYTIEDELRRKAFQVRYDVATNVSTCACKMFESKGLLCRHIFYVLGTKLVKSIPKQYILSRWTKKEYRTPVPISDGNLVHDYDARDVVKLEISNVWLEFYTTIGVVKDMSEQHIKDLVSVLKSLREKVCPPSEPLTKEKEKQKLLGYSTTVEIRIMPQRKSKNKGSGKRLVSDRKVAISKAQKPKRLCANCNQMGNHDRRNCPVKSVGVSEEGDKENSDDDSD